MCSTDPLSSDFQFGQWLSNPAAGEEVVISGISGRFPASDNVQQLCDQLFAKKDLVASIDPRWNLNHPEVPKRGGIIPNISKFDGGFFGLHYRQVQNMDPSVRKFLEVAVEAVIDAGIHPSDLAGTKTGVFVGYSWSEMEAITLRNTTQSQNFAITGNIKSLMAHRVSYYLKLKGPSYVLDSACSSSLNAINYAFRAIRTGLCESALVGAAHLTLHPGVTLQFNRLGVMSLDGSCKVFDQAANGYVRSECIGCIFLQKAHNSKRIYAKIVHSKTNTDGFKSDGIHFPSSAMQSRLMKEVMHESAVTPSQLSYLELHGTATRVGDFQEVQGIDKVIEKHRQEPLLIGSVKSNLGHSEPASGFNAIMKILVAMETGYIAPNLHLKKIKKGLTGIEEERLKVVTEKTLLKNESALIGVNNFGFGGSNCHMILQRFSKKRIANIKAKDIVPNLICVSGRTKEAVMTILDEVKQRPHNSEFIGMLHQVFKRNFFNHPFRGFILTSKTNPVTICMQYKELETCPLYIKFGKLESSFKSVGTFFLNFPVFKKSILKINAILSNKKINIIDIIQNSDEKVECNTLGAFAVLIAIMDTVKALEVTPIVIWENPLGQLACNYFHEVMTLKEIVQAACSMTNGISQKEILDETTTHNQQSSANGSLNVANNLINSKINIVPTNSILINVSDTDLSLAKDPTTFLKTLGRLYLKGYNPQLQNLYPKVNYPVSRGTPFISPMIKWNHDKNWYIVKVDNLIQNNDSRSYSFNLKENDCKYIEGHVIDGRVLFPATGYINLVWKVFALKRCLKTTQLPVIFENCKFIRATIMPKSDYISLSVSIHEGSGNFEILEGDTVVVTGKISQASDLDLPQNHLTLHECNEEQSKLVLKKDDIYKELHLRGYNYGGLFKGLEKCNMEATVGTSKWKNNWSSFMDSMLQLKVLQIDTRRLYVPIGIEKLVIDPTKHFKTNEDEELLVAITSSKATNCIKSGGIEISGLQAREISKRKPLHQPVLEKYEFVPNEICIELSESVRVNTQIVLENSIQNRVTAVEIVDEYSDLKAAFIMPLVYRALEDIPFVLSDLTVSTKKVLEDITGVKIKPVSLTATKDLLLIVITKVLQRSDVLRLVLNALHKNGFVLTREDKNFVLQDNTEISIITQHTIKNEKLILFKKCKTISNIKFVEVSSQQFDWVSELQKVSESEANIVLYSQQDPTDGTLGLINCIRAEPRGNKVKGFFMMDKAPKFDPTIEFYHQQLIKNQAINVYKQSQWGTYRHLLLEDFTSIRMKHSYLCVTKRGDLSSLKWIEGPFNVETEKQKVVKAYYSAVNFKDIMTASGRITSFTSRLNEEYTEGVEYSGKDSRGNRVMGMVPNKAFSTLIEADLNFSWKVPNEWSLEDAATVPCVYSTVIYALLMRTSLKPGTSILIHSATGGIGIAALHVAIHHKCNIFVTVGTQTKRNYLRKHFSQIPENHIGNSRDTSFEELIKQQTNGHGVDIVLNSLSEEKLKASIRCLARGGRFMEIGKFDFLNNSSFNLLLMEKEASYHGIMFEEFLNNMSAKKLQIVEKLNEGIKDGYVKPLPRTVFKPEEAEAAFRYMTTGRHIGKVLLQIREGKDDKSAAVPRSLIKALPKFYCNSNKSYVVIGGLGGFGLELTDWLVLRGARKLVLTSRVGIKDGYQQQRVHLWKSYGALVHISTSDVTSKQGCEDLISDANKIGEVEGVFNLAVVIADTLFENQSTKTFMTALAPKAHAMKNLDKATRKMCPNLKYFVVFSSESCGRGNVGQSNYGMANSIMERICEKRKQEGLPGLAIQWGVVGDVGVLAKRQQNNQELVLSGMLQQKIDSCLSVMDRLLKQDNPVVASMVVADKCDRNYGSGSAVEAVANLLGVKNIKSISQHVTLAQLGMDSMMGTEIIQVLDKDHEIYITSKEIRNLTFSMLNELDAQKCSGLDAKLNDKFVQSADSLVQLIQNNNLIDAVTLHLPSRLESSDAAATVFVLPGIEGVASLLEPLTKNLYAHVVGLQYSFRYPEDSIQKTANTLLPHIEKHLSKKIPFLLTGYSFGTLVTLELASLLESQGYVGKIAIIDGSPCYLEQTVRRYAVGDTEAELQAMLLYHIFAIFLQTNILKQ